MPDPAPTFTAPHVLPIVHVNRLSDQCRELCHGHRPCVLRYRCAVRQDERHNVDLPIHRILLEVPTCCGKPMRPIDRARYCQIRAAIAEADEILEPHGLSIRGLLMQLVVEEYEYRLLI